MYKDVHCVKCSRVLLTVSALPLIRFMVHMATLTHLVILVSTPVIGASPCTEPLLPYLPAPGGRPTVLRPRETWDNVLGFTRQLMDGEDGKRRSKGPDSTKGLLMVYKPLSYFSAAICTFLRMVESVQLGGGPFAAATGSATLPSGNVKPYTKTADCITLL